MTLTPGAGPRHAREPRPRPHRQYARGAGGRARRRPVRAGRGPLRRPRDADRSPEPPAAPGALRHRGGETMTHGRTALTAALAAAALAADANAAPEALVKTVLARLDAVYPDLDTLYCELHRTPELSRHEEKTAARMASRLRALGLDVTEKVGGHGVVGVLRNGKGPTVMLRTELDALPVKEETGLPYASTVTATGEAGTPVGVMHACGHDVHMAAWVGTATLLAGAKDRWRGTLVMVAQPAEEAIAGASAMLADGLYTRFPRPDYAVAVHDTGDFPPDQVAYVPGFALANSSTVHVTVHGRGAHGAYPHLAIDPIVIAARIVVALQTVVAREVNPTDPAVITV